MSCIIHSVSSRVGRPGKGTWKAWVLVLTVTLSRCYAFLLLFAVALGELMNLEVRAKATPVRHEVRTGMPASVP